MRIVKLNRSLLQKKKLSKSNQQNRIKGTKSLSCHTQANVRHSTMIKILQ